MIPVVEMREDRPERDPQNGVAGGSAVPHSRQGFRNAGIWSYDGDSARGGRSTARLRPARRHGIGHPGPWGWRWSSMGSGSVLPQIRTSWLLSYRFLPSVRLPVGSRGRPAPGRRRNGGWRSKSSA
jgi:hypothetical protein